MSPINGEVACCCQSPWVPRCLLSLDVQDPLGGPAPCHTLLLPRFCFQHPGPTSVPLAPAKGLELGDWG